VDVLLVDDVQYLAARVRTEEEFFHTFNVLYETGSQLVLTSDRLPLDLEAVHQRLRERFEAGVVADIQLPDRSTRLTIIRRRAYELGVVARPGALELIAAVGRGVRQLEGALSGVVATSAFTGEPIDRDLTARVLTRLGFLR
jgi:chromosomal replication initiator protein